VGNLSTMKNLTILLILVSFSCISQRPLVGKYYHNNPFSSDTLELFEDNTFRFFINKELLLQRIEGFYRHDKNNIQLLPKFPVPSGYPEFKDISDLFKVYDLLTKEHICAKYNIYKDKKALIKGSTCDWTNRIEADSIVFTSLGYLPYKLDLSKIKENRGIIIFMAPAYYYLKKEYWEGWKIKRGKIVTPFEEFCKSY
jgi:hypothetical protein